jgi:predicted transcriptional regulator
MIKDTTKTPQWKIDAMRVMRSDGEYIDTIAVQLGVSRQTVNRHCSDIEPRQKEPLTNGKIGEFLQKWMPVNG